MITIKVGGKPLYIPKDTTLVLEQNNNVFNPEGFMEDIVWTFSIPAKPNQKTLGAVQYINYMSRRRYDCEVDVDGIPLMRGVLYIQRTISEKQLECGIVANSFGVGFGERLLKENDYGADVVISETEEAHQTGWLSFLTQSLKKESIYKFFLFIDQAFYGENDSYGYYNNQPSGLQDSSLQTMETKYVNRLFWKEMYVVGSDIPTITICQNSYTKKQGVRIFNRAASEKQNGYCFAPAIRLDWLIKKIIDNAGLQIEGNFLPNKFIKNLFSQSMCAMDSDIYQYPTNTWLNVDGNINIYNQTIEKAQTFGHNDEGAYTSFGWVGGSGDNMVRLNFRLLLDTDSLPRRQPVQNDNLYSLYDEIYAFAISTADAALPTLRMRTGTYWNEEDGTRTFIYGRKPTNSELVNSLSHTAEYIYTITFNDGGTVDVEYVREGIHIGNDTDNVSFYRNTASILVQLTASESKPVFFAAPTTGYTQGTVAPRWHQQFGSTTPLFIRLVKCRVKTTNTQSGKIKYWGTMQDTESVQYWPTAVVKEYGRIEELSDYTIEDSLEIGTTGYSLNVFQKMLKWKDHVPNMTNGAFLNAICQLFGLNMFVDNMTKRVQLQFFKDVKDGDSFDISEWVSGIEKTEFNPERYDLTIPPCLGTREVAEQNIIESVANSGSLPSPMANKNKHAYVENEKAYRRSTKDEGSSHFHWQQSGGDNRVCEAGSKNAEEIKEVASTVNIPNMRRVDIDLTEKYLCEIPTKGVSPQFDEDFSGKFDFVLQQYRGKSTLHLQGSGAGYSTALYECANPTNYNDDGTTDPEYINLAAKGNQSIGEMWQKPVYDFIGNSNRYRIIAHLPAWAWWRVMGLLKPQKAERQERWLYVSGLKILPTKISSEFSNRDKIVCTIEGASINVEL